MQIGRILRSNSEIAISIQADWILRGNSEITLTIRINKITCVNALRAPRSLTGLGRQLVLGENGHMAKMGMELKRVRT